MSHKEHETLSKRFSESLDVEIIRIDKEIKLRDETILGTKEEIEKLKEFIEDRTNYIKNENYDLRKNLNNLKIFVDENVRLHTSSFINNESTVIYPSDIHAKEQAHLLQSSALSQDYCGHKSSYDSNIDCAKVEVTVTQGPSVDSDSIKIVESSVQQNTLTQDVSQSVVYQSTNIDNLVPNCCKIKTTEGVKPMESTNTDLGVFKNRTVSPIRNADIQLAENTQSQKKVADLSRKVTFLFK